MLSRRQEEQSLALMGVHATSPRERHLFLSFFKKPFTRAPRKNMADRLWFFLLLPALVHATIIPFQYWSDPGDYVGLGGCRAFPEATHITVSTSPAHHFFTVTTDEWSMTFTGKASGTSTERPPLSIGTYENATRYPFSSLTTPGLFVTGQGRGCNSLIGSFVILEVAYLDSEVEKLAIDFVQRCEGGTPAFHGQIRFHSSIPVKQDPCAAVDCIWNEWSSWINDTRYCKCGTCLQQRTRVEKQVAANGGEKCVGVNKETRSFVLHSCCSTSQGD